jgi:hypothetical protein
VPSPLHNPVPGLFAKAQPRSVPLAWRNLVANKQRLLRSTAGIGFAVLLIDGSLKEITSVKIPYNSPQGLAGVLNAGIISVGAFEADARSSDSETLSPIRSLAGYLIATHESDFSEATGAASSEAV